MARNWIYTFNLALADAWGAFVASHILNVHACLTLLTFKHSPLSLSLSLSLSHAFSIWIG